MELIRVVWRDQSILPATPCYGLATGTALSFEDKCFREASRFIAIQGDSLETFISLLTIYPCACGGQRKIGRNRVSPSTMCGLGMELRSPDLAASVFALWVILQTQSKLHSSKWICFPKDLGDRNGCELLLKMGNWEPILLLYSPLVSVCLWESHLISLKLLWTFTKCEFSF